MIKRIFFRKILFLFMGIVILYTSVISIITCYKGFEFSELQTSHSYQRYLEQTGAYIDYKLQTAYELLFKISTLESFIDYRYSETTDYLLITNLYNDLWSYLNGFNRSGITLSVTKLSDDIVITPEGTFSYTNYLKESGISSAALSSLISAKQSSYAEYTYIIPSSRISSPNKMVILHKLKGNSKVVPVYFFITLDSATFLTKQKNDSSGEFSLYTDEPVACLSGGLGIYNTQALDFVKDIVSPASVNDWKVGRYTHYVYTSEVIPDLKYVYTARSISWVFIVMDTFKSSLLPILLLLLISTWLSYKAASSTYKPINALVSFIGNQDDGHPFTSPQKQAASELEYIQTNIERIYNINHTLKDNLDQSLTQLQEDFFRKIIYGIADECYIREHLGPLKLDGYNRPLRLFLLDCEGIDHISSIISYKNFSLLIYEIIEDFKRLDGPSFVLPLDTKKYCIIIYAEAEGILMELGNYMIDSLSSHQSLDVMVCLSSVYQPADLASGLHELLMLNSHKYSFMDQRILTRETIKDRKETAYLYPLETETCLINYVGSNEHDKGKELLSQLMDKNLRGISLSPANITNLKYSLITTFKRCLNMDGKSLNQFIKEYPTAVDEFLDIPVAQFKEGCLALYDIIFQYCNRDKFSLESSTASKIFMYINENYDKDISLTDIAEHFELSEGYISKLFKSSLDVNFKTYVNKLKVKKAKELLNRRDCRVNDIAAMVGCNNTNTFIRIFKQYEGVSPGEYMKSLK